MPGIDQRAPAGQRPRRRGRRFRPGRGREAPPAEGMRPEAPRHARCAKGGLYGGSGAATRQTMGRTPAAHRVIFAAVGMGQGVGAPGGTSRGLPGPCGGGGVGGNTPCLAGAAAAQGRRCPAAPAWRRGRIRLFLYGTLLDAARFAAVAGTAAPLAAGRPALLPGMRRVRLRGTPYPTLVPDRRGRVVGRVVEVGPPVLRRLSAYEGRPYRLRPVWPRHCGRVAMACAWIAPAGRGLRHALWAPA